MTIDEILSDYQKSKICDDRKNCVSSKQGLKFFSLNFYVPSARSTLSF